MKFITPMASIGEAIRMVIEPLTHNIGFVSSG
jgi:hypothetical protein